MRHDQPSRLTGRVAIVTGGSSGIGKAVCHAMAERGATVVVVGRNRERLTAAVTAIRDSGVRHSGRAKVMSMALDVRREDDMNTMAEQTVSHFGRIDILVASAGILRPIHSRPDPVVNIPVSDWQTVIDTNLKGIFLSNRAVLKTMLNQRDGQIINVGSLSGRRALPLDAPYCASKFAVIGLTESLAEEVRPYGVRVHSLLPGNTDTPIWGQNRLLPRAAKVIPVERVAELIVFLVQSNRNSLYPEISIVPASSHYQTTTGR